MKFVVLMFAMLSASVAMACKDGAVGYITLTDSNDRTYNERRVCKNGTYMNDAEKAAYIYNPRTGCKEGARGSMTKYDSNGRAYTEFRTCKNGSYMNAEERAAYVRVPKNKCKEGSFRRTPASDFGLDNGNSDRPQDITVVCKNGKWRPYSN